MAKKQKDNPIKIMFDKAAEYGITPDELKELANVHTERWDIRLTMDLINKGFIKDSKWTDQAKEVMADLISAFKTTKQKIVIEVDVQKANQYNELFPEMKLPSDKYARCNEREVVGAFQWFFKNYPAYNDWNIIFKATEIYLAEREAKNWEYTRRSMYFIRKTFQDKSVVSDLAEFYKRVVDGVVDQPQNNGSSFEEKVV